MSKTGHPIVSSAFVEVGEKTVDFDLVFQRIRDMDAIQEQLVATLNKTQSELQITKADLSSLKTRVYNSQKALIEASDYYNRRQYYLSVVVKMSHETSQSLCPLYNGHLVEINDKAEFDFIVKFLNNNNVNEYVMVGASDADKEGSWVYLHSGGNLTYFNWGPGEPTARSGDDCMWLSTSSSHQMVDYPCNVAVHLDWRFLCEIPA